jgi:DNA-binding HxlR family transcriptional regulator
MKELESEGLVVRHVIDQVPARVEYELTEKGRALEPTLRSLKGWANDWIQ